ncbi:MAG: hypothetical protein JJT89_14035 [Nitriliruptoraceae bacterium]|nr:hypothetical protein [Nitriliruptoraceae bacterium]
MTERARVVVASPDPATRAFVRLTVGEERFDLIDAEGLEDGVRAVAEQRPEVFVLDVRLGEMVPALLERLRSEPETSAVRTLLLVPRGQDASVDTPGVDAVLVVPATAFALLRKIDRLAAPAA